MGHPTNTLTPSLPPVWKKSPSERRSSADEHCRMHFGVWNTHSRYASFLQCADSGTIPILTPLVLTITTYASPNSWTAVSMRSTYTLRTRNGSMVRCRKTDIVRSAASTTIEPVYVCASCDKHNLNVFLECSFFRCSVCAVSIRFDSVRCVFRSRSINKPHPNPAAQHHNAHSGRTNAPPTR